MLERREAGEGTPSCIHACMGARRKLWLTCPSPPSPSRMRCAQAVWPDCLWTVPKANIPKATLWEAGGIKADQSWLKVGLGQARPAFLPQLVPDPRALTCPAALCAARLMVIR